MAILDRLLSATKEIWAEYDRHPFVRGIADGTLPREKFRYYIVQDYLYLLDYTRVFAVGIAKAKSMETMRLFSSYVSILMDGEMDIHRGYMGKLGVTEQEIAAMPAALDNLSYTSYMLRIAYEEGEAEILAAILACAYSYEVIARNMVKSHPDAVNHPFYGEWVTGYAAAEYSEKNKALIAMLDQLTGSYTEAQLRHLTAIFVACSRYELAFWDLAWNRSK